MTFTITKSFHKVDAELIKSKSTITNVTTDADNVLISTIDNKYPLIKYEASIDDKDKNNVVKLCKGHAIKELSCTNVKFVGNITEKDDAMCVVPKHQFQLILLNKDRHNIDKYNQTYITINNTHNLRHALVEIITNSNPNLCKCHDCYHLVGFVNICEFNIVIQLMCEHDSSSRAIIIMKSTLNKGCLLNTSVLSIIDFFTTCRNNNFSKKIPKRSIVTSVTSNNCDKIYLLSSYGKKGHVWVVPFFSGLNFIGAPGLITNLSHHPRGITIMKMNKANDKTILFVVCNSDKKLTYYSITC